jgi:hypothetical protein
MRVFIDFCMTITCRIGNKGETVLHGTNYATPRLMICMVKESAPYCWTLFDRAASAFGLCGKRLYKKVILRTRKRENSSEIGS